jgi:lysozyme
MTVPSAVLAAWLPVLHIAEGCELQAYPDSAGVWTIGWGHTGPEVQSGLVWTQYQADLQLAQDAGEHYDQLLAIYPQGTGLSPARQAALLDFVYNEGIGNFRSSTLYEDLAAGQLDAVPAQLSRWDVGGGQVLEGLVRRRKAECALWSQG